MRWRFQVLVVAAAGLLTRTAAADAAPDFSREIRPILEQHCLKCHGPEKQKGGLRFDTKEGAFKGVNRVKKRSCPDMPAKAA